MQWPSIHTDWKNIYRIIVLHKLKYLAFFVAKLASTLEKEK